MLAHSDPEAARRLMGLAQEDVLARWRVYEQWATMRPAGPPAETSHD
jgi:hypothetical protein